MSSNNPSFVTVRAQAISLETKTESLLSRFSTFAQTTSSEPTAQETKLDGQIETTLHKRQEVIDLLNNICKENPEISASKLSHLQRHKETLGEHWKSFKNIRSSIQQERNRLNLLFSVKNDIAQHNNSSNNNTGDTAADSRFANEDDYIQNESRRIDQTHNVLDRLIAQAWETREHFAAQSSMLQNVNTKTMQVLQRIPGINQVMKRIGVRRRKNALILATVITVCILIFFFTW